MPPFTGSASIHGKILKGRVLATKVWRTITTRRNYLHCTKKSNRVEKRHSNMAVHCRDGLRQPRGLRRQAYHEPREGGDDPRRRLGGGHRQADGLANKAHDASAVDSNAARCIARSLGPEWNEYVEVDDYQTSDALEFHVMDYDYLTKDDWLGTVTTSDADLAKRKFYRILTLGYDKEHGASGKLVKGKLTVLGWIAMNGEMSDELLASELEEAMAEMSEREKFQVYHGGARGPRAPSACLTMTQEGVTQCAT